LAAQGSSSRSGDGGGGGGVLSRAMLMAAQKASAGDPHFSSVELLMHMDGSDGGTTFTDSSKNALTFSRHYTPTTETEQKLFGTASGYFNYVSTTDEPMIYNSDASNDSRFSFDGDFTIELAVYLTAQHCSRAASGEHIPLGTWSDSGGEAGWYLDVNRNTGTTFSVRFVAVVSAGVYALYYIPSATLTYLAANTWHRIAVTRSGSTIRLFHNGTHYAHTKSGTVADNATFPATPNDYIMIGGVHSSGASFQGQLNGYIDEVRITKGVARYTGNYTLATAAFPDA
jgi:hypothetical protein